MTREIKTFFDERTWTLTYVLYDSETRDAVVIDPVLDYEPASAVLVNFTLDAVTLGSDGWQIAADFLWQPFKQKRPFLRVNRQRHVPTHGDFAGSSRADFATKEHITWRIDGDRACAFGLCE